jgi:hypothetical protein
VNHQVSTVASGFFSKLLEAAAGLRSRGARHKVQAQLAGSRRAEAWFLRPKG